MQKSRTFLSEPATPELLRWVIATIGAMAAALILFVISSSSAGFDFSDEGYYLNSLADPWHFPASETQFGFIYHPLFELLGKDVAALRYLSRAIDLLLAVAIFCILISRIARPGVRQIRWQDCACAVALATAVMASCQDWLPTPSYNSLNLQALLAAVVGLEIIGDDPDVRRSLYGGALVGLAGWLSLMAKPTTAALLAAIVLLYLLLAARNRWLCVFSAAGTAVLLTAATALIIDSSFGEFIARYRLAWNLSSINSDTYTLQRFYENSGLGWTPFERNVFWFILAGQAFLTWLTLQARTAMPIILITVLTATVLGVVLGDTSLVTLQESPLQGMWLGAVGFGSTLGCLLSKWRDFRGRMNARNLMLVVLVFLLPPIYAFGTNNNLWAIATYSSVFWIVASVFVLGMCCTRSESTSILTLLSAAVVGITAVHVGIGVERPFRQLEPLRLQRTASTFGPSGATRLNLDKASAAYIATLRSASVSSGMLPGTPMIDLTGRHPGTVFALEARAPGIPWLLSGYPGSTMFAMSGLELATCATLARSWLLFSPTTRVWKEEWLPEVVLSHFGFDLRRDYLEVVKATPPTGFGEQTLLKPVFSPHRGKEICESALKGVLLPSSAPDLKGSEQ